MPADRERGPRARLLALAVAIYAALALWLGRGVLTSPWHTILGSPGDNFGYLWRIWWFKQTLVGPGSPFFAPHILYPEGWRLGTIETATAYTVLGLPVTAALGIVAAYNVFVLGSFVIAGLGAFLLTHRLTRSGPAALTAGAVFAFCPYHVAHAGGHLNLMGSAWIPWVFWFAERAMDRRRARDAAGAAVAYGLAALSSWHYAYFLALFLPLYVWLRLRGEKRRVLSARGLALALVFAGVAAAMVMPAALPTLRLPPELRPRHGLSALVLYSASPTDFVAGNPWHPLWGGWVRQHFRPVANWAENALFVGWLPLLLAAIGLRRRSPAAAYFWVGVAGFVLALGPLLHWNGDTVSLVLPGAVRPVAAKVLAFIGSATHRNLDAVLAGGRLPVPLPGALLALGLPFFAGMRVMARFGVLVALAIAVLAGMGLARLGAGRPRRVQWGAALAALAVVIFEFAGTLPVSQVAPSPADRWLARQRGEFTVAYLPAAELWDPVHVHATRWHGKRLLGGAETFMPPAFEERYRLMERFPDPAAQGMLAACGVRYVLLNTRAWRGGPVTAPWLREMARAGDTVIYELRAPAD